MSRNDCLTLRRLIFRQTIPIEKARVTPLPTEFVKYDVGKHMPNKGVSCAPGGIALKHPKAIS